MEQPQGADQAADAWRRFQPTRARSAMSPSLKIRWLGPDDQALLWDVLHIALWDPPPALLRPKAVLQSPHIRIYAENWGRSGDIGVVLELAKEGEGIGACWMRLLADQQGLRLSMPGAHNWASDHSPAFRAKPTAKG